MISKELSRYIESLRKRRNIDLDTFNKDIVSIRQYKRYLSGDSEMPYRAFILFAERLGFNPVKIQGDLELQKEEESKRIEEFYNQVIRKNYEKAEQAMNSVDSNNFLLPELEVYYKTTVVLLHYFRDNKPPSDCRDEIFDIIDYPNILKKDLYEQTELLVLSLLLMFAEGKDKSRILDKLNEQLMKEKITLGNEYYARLYVLLRVTREYGIAGDNDKVIQLCLKALEASKRPHIHFNYDFLYYYLSLSYRNNKDMTQAIYYARKLYNYLLFVDEEKKMQKYNTKMIKDFGKDFVELLDEKKELI